MPERLRDINLLPKYERQSSNMFYIFIAMIIFTLLAYAFIGVSYFTTSSKLKTAETEHTQLREEVDGLLVQMGELETDDNSLDQAVNFIENHEIPTSTFIVELTDLLPDYSYLSNYTYGSQVAKITTQFETLDAVANYTTNLLTSEFIRDTKVDNVDTFGLKEEIENDNEVDFGIISRYESEFTLQINKQTLKGESQKDE